MDDDEIEKNDEDERISERTTMVKKENMIS